MELDTKEIVLEYQILVGKVSLIVHMTLII